MLQSRISGMHPIAHPRPRHTRRIVTPAPPRWLDERAKRGERIHRLRTIATSAPIHVRRHNSSREATLTVELARVVGYLALVLVAVMFLLPRALEFASAPLG